jgi:type I restriction enzyme S subunit
MRLKDAAFINRRVLPETTDPDYSFRYIDISAVDGIGTLAIPTELTRFENAPSRARRIAPSGSTVISTVRTYLRAIARVPETEENLVFSTGFAILEAKPYVDDRFLAYACQSQQFIDDVVARSVGVSYPAINPGDLACIALPMFPVEQQRRIADFLDAETARIDAVSNSRKAQIRALDLKWKVQIRDAVSGAGSEQKVEKSLAWLGPINSSWPTVLLGVISRTYMGTTFPHEYQGNTEGDFPFTKVADFSAAGADLTLAGADNWVSKETARKLGARIVPPRSILYARVGAAMLLNQRRITLRSCIVDDNVRALSFEYGNPRYWLYLLTCLDLGELANPGPVPSVSEGQVSGVRIPFPSTEEQDRIVRGLDAQAANIAGVRNLIDRQLQSLAERRQALITAAVTGGITV